MKTIEKKSPPEWSYLALLLVGWLTPAVFFVYAVHFLYEFDSYFHVHLAEIMSKHGLFLKEFPWVSESIWVSDWFDKEWLFHILLIPFLSLGRTEGAQLFILFLNILIVLALWYACRTLKLRPKAALFWLLILPWSCWGVFWVRLVMCRPHLLSIVILFLALGAMLRRKRLMLAVISLVYALSYAGHWQLLGLVLIYDIFYTVFDDNGALHKNLKFGWPMLVAALAGMIVGELVHPNFPANIKGLWVQNVRVLFESWEGTAGIVRPNELRPTGVLIFSYAAPVFIGFGVMLFRIILRRIRWSRDIYLLAVYTSLYLFLSVKSIRFLEYFIPVSVIFLATFFEVNPFARSESGNRAWPKLIVAVSICISLLIGAHGYAYYYRRYAVNQAAEQDGTHRYAGAAAWLRKNLEPGEIVFSTEWGANPLLWAQAPDQRYLTFLDPTFMQQKSSDRFEYWFWLRTGRYKDPAQKIIQIFHSRVAFILTTESTAGLIRRLAETGYEPVYRGKTGELIYLLAKEPVF